MAAQHPWRYRTSVLNYLPLVGVGTSLIALIRRCLGKNDQLNGDRGYVLAYDLLAMTRGENMRQLG